MRFMAMSGAIEAYSVGHWLREVAALSGPAGGDRRRHRAVFFGADRRAGGDPADPAEVRAEADARRLARRGSPGCWPNLTPRRRRGSTWPTRCGCSARGRCCAPPGGAWPRGRPDTGPPLLPLDRAEALVLRPDVAWLNARIDRTLFRHAGRRRAGRGARPKLPHWDPARPSAKAIGAPELIAHLRGEIDAGRRHATPPPWPRRQYAKRQRTWFRTA